MRPIVAYATLTSSTIAIASINSIHAPDGFIMVGSGELRIARFGYGRK